MTTFQILSILVLVAAVAWTYMPRIAIPSISRKPNVLRQIQQVMAIRDSSDNPGVVETCNQLLQALLQ